MWRYHRTFCEEGSILSIVHIIGIYNIIITIHFFAGLLATEVSDNGHALQPVSAWSLVKL